MALPVICIRMRQDDMRSGTIFDIKRYAIHDGPGIRTTVFFKGCPLSCAWCHNPGSWQQRPQPSVRVLRCQGCARCVEACAHSAVTMKNGKAVTDAAVCVRCGTCQDVCLADARDVLGRTVTVEDLITDIERDRIFFDESGGGVTFSGGEPLDQAEFLCELLEACGRKGLHTAVDTTCHAEVDVIERVARDAQLFLCDLKHLNSEQHALFTGVGNELILSNIRQLTVWGAPVRLRMPLIPGFNDSHENVRQTINFIKSINTVPRIDLLPYNRAGLDKAERLGACGPVLKDFGPLDDVQVNRVAAEFRQAQIHVIIGG